MKKGLIVTEKPNKLFAQLLTVSIETSLRPLTLNLVYRSPNSSSDNNNKLNGFMKLSGSRSLTVGDMNYPGINWDNGIFDSAGKDFFNSCQDAFLDQNVHFCTHGDNTLDLIIILLTII